MISCHLGQRKLQKQPRNATNPSILAPVLHQRSIKNCWQSKNTGIKNQSTKQSQKPTIIPLINQINDENCSYNANKIQNENFSCQQREKKQNKVFLNLQNKAKPQMQQDEYRKCAQVNKVVNLKKKIKKCPNHFMNSSQSYFREKVSFIRKTYTIKNLECKQSENEEIRHLIGYKQEEIETYPVFRDSQVFGGYRSQQLRNRLVSQRMDNDTETDDEHIEKFVNRIKSDFLLHLQRVEKQKQESNENGYIQKIDHPVVQ